MVFGGKPMAHVGKPMAHAWDEVMLCASGRRGLERPSVEQNVVMGAMGAMM